MKTNEIEGNIACPGTCEGRSQHPGLAKIEVLNMTTVAHFLQSGATPHDGSSRLCLRKTQPPCKSGTERGASQRNIQVVRPLQESRLRRGLRRSRLLKILLLQVFKLISIIANIKSFNGLARPTKTNNLHHNHSLRFAVHVEQRFAGCVNHCCSQCLKRQPQSRHRIMERYARIVNPAQLLVLPNSKRGDTPR